MRNNISISILDAKDKILFLDHLNKIKEQLFGLNIKANIFEMSIHLDVMDKKFVLNEGVSLDYITRINNIGFYVDVHLMVKNPIEDCYIDKAIMLGADNITIHYEIEDFENVLKYLLSQKRRLKEENRNLSIGVALNPETKISVLKKYASKLDRILLMSVEPGKGGQKYIDSVTDKMIFLKNTYPKVIIQVDGGINEYTIQKPLRANIDSIVVGSYLSKASNYDELYKKLTILNCINTIETTPRRANLKLDMTTLQVVPGGYGEDDILLGINVPDMRKCALAWYKYINIDALSYFIASKYHDYRRFAVLCIISNVVKLYKRVINDKKNKVELKKLKEYFSFFEKNIEHVNNWDLTDIAGPNILAYNLYILNEKKRKKKVFEYLNSNNIWTKRIGIVSMLNFVRNKNMELPLEVCDFTIYDEFHLFQKATGWLLREMYKIDSKFIVEYLSKKNSERKLPSILLSYACEKMTIEEKEKIRKEF